MLRPLATVLAAAVIAASCPAANSDPTLPDVLRELGGAIQPEEAMAFMRRLYSTDRYFTFPKFQETAEYLRGAMTGIGLQRVELLGAPADGVTQAGYWTMPLAWDVNNASLEIIEPKVSGESRVLADYKKIPASLGMWSGPTPAGGITAEIVDLPKASPVEIAKLDLRGKLVLTSQNPAGFKWALVKAGALGAINAFTENPALEDGRQWINSWGDHGWAFTKTSTPLLSFSITPRQAALVRSLIAGRGAIRVHAVVDSRYYSGVYPYVTAVIPGTGPEEVLTLGHTSEQGAGDNSTGVAATLESLATIERLIAAGKLPRPKRSIRILAMGELYGSMHYAATYPERMRRTVAAMCVDTPAASYDLAGTEYTFHMNPHVSKSFSDAFILRVAQEYFSKTGRPWHEKEFTTGTDTYLAEPLVGVPTVWPYSGSGVETHHNSEDTPARVDPRSLGDVAIVNAAFLYYISNAQEPQAMWLAQLSQTRGYQQILKAAAPFLDAIAQTNEDRRLGLIVRQALDKIEYAAGRETQAVRSVLTLVPEDRRDAARDALAPLATQLHRFADEQFDRVRAAARQKAGHAVTPLAPPDPQLPMAARIIVKRKRFGTLPLDDLPEDQREGYPSGAWAAVPTIALYWCDGRRTLAEVIHLTRMELGPSDFDFVGYFRFLRKHGYVDFLKE